MQRPKAVSIKQTLMRISLLTAGFALILSTALLIVEEVIAARKGMLNELSVQTEIIGNNSTAALSFNDPKTAKEILSALRANENIEFAALYTKEGALFADYSRDGLSRVASQHLHKEGHRFGLDYLEVCRDVVLDREVIGSIHIQSNLRKVYGDILRVMGVLIAAILFALSIAYFFSTRMQKAITSPISDLVRTINTISDAKDYSVRSALKRDDELGTLSEGFNAMPDQIQSRDIELETHRNKLSLLVDERTEQLGRANEQLQNELIERKLAEEEIVKLNEELEKKVEERTQQLLEAQEELVRKEKLAILGQLSGSVGHELRNPLGVISNAIYYLKTVMPGAAENVREYLDLIKNEVNNSERIISDLLDFSRTKTPQAASVTPAEAINRCLEQCAIPENVALEIDVPDTLPLVKVDPLQMGQVFQNLITNAVQAMPEGGSLRIAARRVSSSEFQVLSSDLKPETSNLTPDGDFVEISVSDTGEGISPENMKKLFQPLFTTKAKGIGLGLVVCKKLTEANGGRIRVESQAGKGTTFTLFLPTKL